MVKNGDLVSVEYTGKLEDGTVFDTSVGKNPLVFEVGKHQVIKGFEDAVLGMSTGESKTVTIPVAEAYGEYRKELVRKFPANLIAPDPSVTVGSVVTLQDPQGRKVSAKVVEMTEQNVTLDFNHPLAGKALVFEVKIMKVEAPK